MRRHDVLLPINQNYGKIQETNKASIELWTILKRRYECWKTQQFTQQSAAQRAQNDTYCPITSMTCATVRLILKSGCWKSIKIENFVIVLIKGVIAQVVSKSDDRKARGRSEITSTITPWILRTQGPITN